MHSDDFSCLHQMLFMAYKSVKVIHQEPIHPKVNVPSKP